MNNFIPLSIIKQEVAFIKRVYHFGRLIEFLEESKDKLIMFDDSNEGYFMTKFFSIYSLAFPNFAFSGDELQNIMSVENINTLIRSENIPYEISEVKMTRPEDTCVIVKRKDADIPDKDFFNQCFVDMVKSTLLE